MSRKKHCRECPFKTGEAQKDACFMRLLEEGRREGVIEVHACHMVSQEARPKNDKEVCYGHLMYVRENG